MIPLFRDMTPRHWIVISRRNVLIFKYRNIQALCTTTDDRFLKKAVNDLLRGIAALSE